MLKIIFTCFTFISYFNIASAEVNIVISNIDSQTVEFKRAGIIPIGVESLLFSDDLGKNYELSCGGNRLRFVLYKSSSWSDFTINGNYEDCNQKVFVDLKEQIVKGAKLDSLNFILQNKILKSGRTSPITEVLMESFFKD